MQGSDSPRRSTGLVTIAAVFVLILAAGLGLYYNASQANHTGSATTFSGSSLSSSTSTSLSGPTSSSTMASTPTTIIANGTTFQVQSSFDCLAGHYNQSFTATSNTTLSGAFSTQESGVTVYLATAEQAQTLSQGHPSAYVDSWAANSTFSETLTPGSYVLWVEGADSGCNATIVEPLEMLTTVTVTQAITLS